MYFCTVTKNAERIRELEVCGKDSESFGVGMLFSVKIRFFA